MTTDTTARVSGTIKASDLVTILARHFLAVHGQLLDAAHEILAAIQPDPEPGATENYADPVSSAGTEPQPDHIADAGKMVEPQPVAWQRNHPGRGWIDVHPEDIEHYRSVGQAVRPLYATPYSAGTVSVEAAARVLLASCPNPIFDILKPALMGEIRERVCQTDEYGDEVTFDRQVPWDTMKTVIRAALRALAGERG